MGASPMLHFRMSPKFLAKVEEAASKEGITVSLWVRRLIEKEIGMSSDLPYGVAAMGQKQRKERLAKAIETRKRNKQNKNQD